MRKIVLLSFDDGTVQDRKLVEVLNRRGAPGTFNLNSGLGDFVWQFEGHDVVRPPLESVRELYTGHEVAGHGLTHAWLPGLTDEQLRWEVGEDQRRIGEVFGHARRGFSVPFSDCGAREVAVLKDVVPYIRLSAESESFALPPDPWHIPIHGLIGEVNVEAKIRRFAHSELPVSLFVLCGHAYELEFLDRWPLLEKLLEQLQAVEDAEFMTTMAFVQEFCGV